jgi:hypothetical protein
MISTPSPHTLCEAPELAALALLDTALAVASNALLAVHGELLSGDFPDQGCPGLQAFVADTLVLQIRGLQTTLDRYCAALRQVDACRPIADPGC